MSDRRTGVVVVQSTMELIPMARIDCTLNILLHPERLRRPKGLALPSPDTE